MKLSIIIPVYQVKDTLCRCLDSILQDTFRDWQMILVDDASTDGSADICDDYAQRDHRIQVIHLRQNSGLSAARNKGLDHAHGDYIIFVDSDDYLADGTVKALMETLAIHPDYDMLEFPVFEHYGSREQSQLRFLPKEFTDFYAYWLHAEAYRHTYAWNKVYRHEVLRGLHYPVGRKFEDVFMLPQVLKHCNIVATTDVGMYYYIDNPQGITHQASAADLSDMLEAHITVLRRLATELGPRASFADFAEVFSTYYTSVLNVQLDVYDASGKFFVPQADRPANETIPTFPILPFYGTWKLKLLHLLGLHTLCRLHKTLRHNR